MTDHLFALNAANILAVAAAFAPPPRFGYVRTSKNIPDDLQQLADAELLSFLCAPRKSTRIFTGEKETKFGNEEKKTLP